MSQDWITAYEALRSVYADGAYSNIALNEAIPHHPGCRDSFVRSMVKGTIRQTVTLDRIIDMLAESGIRGIRRRTLIILRMGLYALRDMDSVPDHAAVNEAVSLARKKAKGTDRFVNAILRNYIRKRDIFETAGDPSAEAPFIREISDAKEKLSVKYSFPVPVVQLISAQYGDETEKILDGLNTPPPVILRVNTLRTSREDLLAELKASGIDAEPVPENDRAVSVSGGSIIATDLYRNGMFTVQSLSSIMAVSALAPQPGDKVLDMCAAPGGKTAMMAEMMDNRGSITACDVHPHRLELIDAAAERLGIDIIETRLADGTEYDETMAEQFDCVLADVPCSGLGVMSTKPEIRFHVDDESISELPEIQKAVLSNALRYTKPGGKICYSTCTLDRPENEDIIDDLLTKHGGLVRIVEMRTILPYNNVIGFFFCIIEKMHECI